MTVHRISRCDNILRWFISEPEDSVVSMFAPGGKSVVFTGCHLINLGGHFIARVFACQVNNVGEVFEIVDWNAQDQHVADSFFGADAPD